MASLERGHRMPYSQQMPCMFVIAGVAFIGRVCETFSLPTAPGPMRLSSTLNHWWICMCVCFFPCCCGEGTCFQWTVERDFQRTTLSFLLEKEGHWDGPRHIWVLVPTSFCLLWDLRCIVWLCWAPRQRNESCPAEKLYENASKGIKCWANTE